MKTWAFILCLLTIALRVAQSQAPAQMAKDAHPTFEVATIKLSDPDSHRQGIGSKGR